MPIGSKESSLTVGPDGPMLLQDVEFLDELAHFDRERIPERVVHAKGAGQFGIVCLSLSTLAVIQEENVNYVICIFLCEELKDTSHVFRYVCTAVLSAKLLDRLF